MGFTFNPFTGNFDVVINGAIPEVNTQADLPAASTNTGKTVQVLNNTGIWPYTLGFGTQKGYFRSDGTNWVKVEVSAEVIQNQIDIASTTDRDRANHTGTQPISTIDNLQPSLDAKADQTALDAEETARINADNTLQSNIDDKASQVSQDAQDLLIAANTAKLSATGTELEPEDIDTLAELNAIVTDATLIDTNDPRLSDDRDPNPHTHVEADITDLDKYTQAEVDNLLALQDEADEIPYDNTASGLAATDVQAALDELEDEKVQLNTDTTTFYVAPDVGSSSPGDFIAGAGIRDAIREANKFIMTNPNARIDIRLRDGEYTLVESMECSHPQAKKSIRIQADTAMNTTTIGNINTGLVLNDQAADEALIEANYSVKVNCPSYALFLNRGTGFEDVRDIYFKYTGSITSRAGCYVAQQGGVRLTRCAFLGFPYGVRAVEFSSVSAVTGFFALYCNLQAVRAEEMSVVRVSLGSNYSGVLHSVSSYTALITTAAYMRLSGSSVNSRLKIQSDTTNRACVFTDDKSKVVVFRCDTVGGSNGVYLNKNSDGTISTMSITGNNSRAIDCLTNSTAEVISVTIDAAGTNTQRTVRATGSSFITETGTHSPTIIFDPTIGSGTDVSRIV